jgi:glycosyltransferase involved in cell wall biosynthesis
MSTFAKVSPSRSVSPAERAPEITVIMAVHNGLPYLPAAVSSILTQTYPNLTLLVVDDGSTDGTQDYLRTLKDPRVRIMTMSERGGQGAARNLALTQCRGKYIALMDADDVSRPSRLAEQKRYLDEHRQTGVVGTRVEYIGNNGRAGFAPPLATAHSRIREDLLAGRHALVNPTLMFRAEILRQLGGYQIAGAGEDWDLFLRATEITQVANVDEPLYWYRIHLNNTNFQQARTLRLRYAHACDCARRRAEGLAKLSFSEFVDCQSSISIWRAIVDDLDQFSGLQYRKAIGEILDGRAARGYARLAMAAGCSPGRLLQRLRRQFRSGDRPQARPSS